MPSGRFSIIPDERLIESYRRTGSVWKTADEVGICGQAVHWRLKRCGALKPVRYFTSEDAELLKREYERHARAGRLDALCAIMRRTKPFLCNKAKALGIPQGNAYEPDRAAIGADRRQWIAQHGHPRGALGMTHGVATRAKISARVKAAVERRAPEQENMRIDKMMTTKFAKYGRSNPAVFNRGKATTWKAAWREIAGKRIYFRSRWEYNYAVYLQMLVEKRAILSWEHEPKTFWFDKIKRGVRSYLPDFRVQLVNGGEEYHEVKGWMDDRSKTCISRMARYYPEVTLKIIDATWFKNNGRILCFLPGWEHASR